MNKIAHYLQEHLLGEVMTSSEALSYFSTDASVLSVTANVVVYPRNENDIRKAARFTWQLAERGRVMPITARGSGTDQSGAAIGNGIIMVFPAHMHHLVDFDSKTGAVTVEPGINYGKLQQALHSHRRFLPPYPASQEYSTVGGAIGNNASGIKSIKYGCTRDYVKSLRVVLANGEVIETRRLTKRELNKKLGLATLEGEIYRNLDTLIEENWDAVLTMHPTVAKNSSGYALDQVKRKDGSFDLTPLFVGAQGTLGIVSEAVLETEIYNPDTVLLAAHIDDLQVAEEILLEISKLPEQPSAVEAVDGNLLRIVEEQNPNLLKGSLEQPFAKLVLLIEFDNMNDRSKKRLVKKVEKLLSRFQVSSQVETDPVKQDQLWKVRELAAVITSQSQNGAKAVPLIEDGVVPLDRFKEYLEGVYALLERNGLQSAAWGHAGSGNLHFQPMLDLSQVGDRQKAFRLLSEYYELVVSLGGTLSGEHGDGRIRAPFLASQYKPEVYELMQRVKKIFDPYGTLNPNVKMNVGLDDIKPLVRSEYSLDRFMHHLPRS
jgi:FAD/FMN-containing dehydrogenase